MLVAPATCTDEGGDSVLWDDSEGEEHEEHMDDEAGGSSSLSIPNESGSTPSTVSPQL